MAKRSCLHIFSVLSLLAALALTSCVAHNKMSGELSGQLVWGGAVYIDGDVELPAESSLRILPGTEVIFLPPHPGQRSEHPFFHGSELIVRGRLIAEGTAQNPIVFRSIDPDAGPGAWGSVNLTESPHASFRYCRFMQADSAIHSQKSGEVIIKESVFDNNQVAIRFHSTPILIENNLIQNNEAGIRFHFGAPIVRKNKIFNNEKGVFITSHPQDYRFEKNNFLNNSMHVVLGEEVSEDIDMGHNFWNAVTPSPQLFFDGRRSSYLGTVNVLPVQPEPAKHSGPSWTP